MKDYREVTITQQRYDELRDMEREVSQLRARVQWNGTLNFPRDGQIVLALEARGAVYVARYDRNTDSAFYFDKPGIFISVQGGCLLEAVVAWQAFDPPCKMLLYDAEGRAIMEPGNRPATWSYPMPVTAEVAG